MWSGDFPFPLPQEPVVPISGVRRRRVRRWLLVAIEPRQNGIGLVDTASQIHPERSGRPDQTPGDAPKAKEQRCEVVANPA